MTKNSSERFSSEFKILNFINGKFVHPVGNKFIPNENPAIGERYSWVAQSGPEDVESAVVAAKRAFPSWSSTTARERSQYLLRMAELISERKSEFAFAESIDSGKPLSLALEVDIPRSQKNLEFFAHEVLNWKTEKFESLESQNEVLHSPLGVVACISPWNLPLYLFTWKIAPALAAGNTVVAKPSEMTPMTAQMLCEVAEQANLPQGVFNVIHGFGSDIGPTLCKHPSVKAVTFTGSTATGKLISEMTAGSFKKVSLEMGGKNANIVFADCDFEKAVSTTVRSSFSNQGQICLCGSRILIEQSIFDKFKTELVARVKKLKQGDPQNPETQQGAVVSLAHMNKVLGFIELARKSGGVILCGGKRLDRPGFYIEPTLIEGLPTDSPLNQEEIFGPVATLIPFKDVNEAIEIANGTKYGLAASVWTLDIEKAKIVSTQLQTGVVWINTWMTRDLRTPFGGVKHSGVGREGGRYALEFMTEMKTVCRVE